MRALDEGNNEQSGGVCVHMLNATMKNDSVKNEAGSVLCMQ